MAGILIERGGYLKEILHLLGAEHWDCNWLITALECYDYCGWPGCEKWASETLFLTNEELLHDVDLRDMQFVWGILSAIPSRYSREEVLAAGMPDFQDEDGNWLYGSEILLPQHPLAFLEIMSEDSSTVTVIAQEAEALSALPALSDWTEDAEAENRRFRQMQRIADALQAVHGWGQMSEHTRRNLHGSLWHHLYHHRPEREVREEDVRALYMAYWEGNCSCQKNSRE